MRTAFETVVVIRVTVAGETFPSFIVSLTKRTLSCAAMNGVDETIVERANYLMDISAKGEDLVSACAQTSEKEEDDLKDAVIESACTI